MNIIQWDKTNCWSQNIIQWDKGWQIDKLNIIQWDKGWQIIQWDNGWQTVEHKTLFSEIRVDKLNIIREIRVQIEHYSVR